MTVDRKGPSGVPNDPPSSKPARDRARRHLTSPAIPNVPKVRSAARTTAQPTRSIGTCQYPYAPSPHDRSNLRPLTRRCVSGPSWYQAAVGKSRPAMEGQPVHEHRAGSSPTTLSRARGWRLPGARWHVDVAGTAGLADRDRECHRRNTAPAGPAPLRNATPPSWSGSTLGCACRSSCRPSCRSSSLQSPMTGSEWWSASHLAGVPARLHGARPPSRALRAHRIRPL